MFTAIVDNRQDPELIQVHAVSGTYFQTLGVGAQVGRVLNDSDDSSEGDHPVLVISDGFWKRMFGGDPSILNHKLRLGSVVYDIVGVAPAEFFGTKVGEAPDAWAPISMAGVIPPGWGRYKDELFRIALHPWPAEARRDHGAGHGQRQCSVSGRSCTAFPTPG